MVFIVRKDLQWPRQKLAGIGNDSSAGCLLHLRDAQGDACPRLPHAAAGCVATAAVRAVMVATACLSLFKKLYKTRSPQLSEWVRRVAAAQPAACRELRLSARALAPAGPALTRALLHAGSR